MNDIDIEVQGQEQALRRLQRGISPIWIVPLAALLIACWLVYENLSSRGPLITLITNDAEGIEAGTTLIKTLNVEVGRVEEVRLSEDFSHTLITARMRPEVERMLVEDSRFWVVKPRIGRDGISGLSTVLSGTYIQLQSGQSERAAREFDVLEQPLLAPSGAAGLHLRLLSELGNSVRVGDPVSYQGFTVGRVEEATYDPDTRQVRHRVFIEAPYDSLITENTRFWHSSGIDLRLDSEGIRLSIASLESLLVGGVTFGHLAELDPGEQVQDDTGFSLYPDEETALHDSFYDYLEYVLLIDNTVRGLSAGAPVEYRGVRVGTVVSVPWNFSTPAPGGGQQFAIPVLIRIEPQRITDDDSDQALDLSQWEQRFEELFQQGLRATLKTGNLVTGALFVDLNLQGADGQDGYVASRFGGRPVFPSTSSSLAQIEQQISALLDKLNNLEIEPVLTRMEQTLASTDRTMRNLQQLGSTLQELMGSPEAQALPANIERTLAQMRTMLEGFAPGSATHADLQRTLQGLHELLRELQPVARTLNEQPNALIFDRRAVVDPEPRALAP